MQVEVPARFWRRVWSPFRPSVLPRNRGGKSPITSAKSGRMCPTVSAVASGKTGRKWSVTSAVASAKSGSNVVGYVRACFREIRFEMARCFRANVRESRRKRGGCVREIRGERTACVRRCFRVIEPDDRVFVTRAVMSRSAPTGSGGCVRHSIARGPEAPRYLGRKPEIAIR